MKKLFLLMIALVANATFSQAQLLTFTATTGDVEMDDVLTEVHNNALKDIVSFKKDVSATFSLSTSKIDLTLKILSPGDLYMAAQVAASTNKPFDDVVKTYQSNKTKGWGAIAKDLGIKPGSPEFHAMKKSLKSKKGSSGSKGKSDKPKGKGKKK